MQKDTSENKNENFFAQVHAVVAQIPFGKVTTYGHIAAYLGTKGSARMVGWALNGNIKGSIKGNIKGSIKGNIKGSIKGNIKGSIKGNIKGNVGFMDMPCHRVVNRFGALSGRLHFGSPTMMEDLLRSEGIGFTEDDCVDLSQHLWIPV